MSAIAIRWVLWAALLASVGLHAAVPLLVELPPVEAPPRLAGVLALAGVACAVAAVVVRQLGLRRPIARGALDPADPAHGQRVATALLASWALAEAPSVLGLALAFLSGEPRGGWPLAGLSAVVLALLAPRLPAAPRSSAELARGDVRIG